MEKWDKRREELMAKHAELKDQDMLISMVLHLMVEMEKEGEKIKQLEKEQILLRAELEVCKGYFQHEEMKDIIQVAEENDCCASCGAGPTKIFDGECEWCAAGGYVGENKIF